MNAQQIPTGGETHPMDAQSIFETVATHLFNQGVQSMGNYMTRFGEEVMCLYRGPNSTKCAAGCLIRDEDYNSTWENLRYESYMTPHIEENHYSLIRTLQYIHDQEESWGSTPIMQLELAKVATRYALNANFLSNLKFSDR